MKTKLNNHFIPKQNKHHARYQFLQIKPNVGESIIAYTARLRKQAKECEFGDASEERILEHIIQTIDNRQLIQKTTSRKWNLTQFLQEASQIEDVNHHVREMKTQEEKPVVAKVYGHRQVYGKNTNAATIPSEIQPTKWCNGSSRLE